MVEMRNSIFKWEGHHKAFFFLSNQHFSRKTSNISMGLNIVLSMEVNG